MTASPHVVPGVDPSDQRRVSVVCRTTRVDVSLPAHLELVAVIPELVGLVRGHVRSDVGPGTLVDVDERMGAGAGGTWRLSRLSGATLAVSESLAQQRVHDGEILVLDRRPVATPPPLFDDVLQGLTDPGVASGREWSSADATRLVAGLVGGATVLALGAVLHQWWDVGGVLPAALAWLLAVVALVTWPVLRRVGAPAYALSTTAVAAVVSPGVAVTVSIPGMPGASQVVAGLAASTVVAALLRATTRPSTPGDRPRSALLLALGIAAAVGTVAAAVTLLVDVVPAPAAGAGATVVGLIGLTLAPRIAVSASRIPVPPVPAPGEDVAGTDVDHDVTRRGGDRDPSALPLPTPTALRGGAAAARSVLAGLLGGFGTVVAAGALVALTGSTGRPAWAAVLALVLLLVLVLRGLAYTDRLHTAALLGPATVLTLGVLTGATATAADPATAVVPAALAVAAAAVVAGVVVPRTEFSPGLRAAVGVVEAVLITSVVPIALGVMGVYGLVRHR